MCFSFPTYTLRLVDPSYPKLGGLPKSEIKGGGSKPAPLFAHDNNRMNESRASQQHTTPPVKGKATMGVMLLAVLALLLNLLPGMSKLGGMLLNPLPGMTVYPGMKGGG